MTSYRYGVAHEAITNLINAQPATERLEYKQVLLGAIGLEETPATEAIANGAGRARLVEALYHDILSKKTTDFGKIPESRGNLADLPYYKNMINSIHSLNDLVGENANPDMVRMNALHEAIIQERNNFEFGFKLNIEIIMYTYNTLVEALMDIINTNIVTYVDYLKETQNISVQLDKNINTQSMVTRAVDTFLSIRKKGEWKKLINSYRDQYGARNFTAAGLATGIAITGIGIIGIIALLYGIRQLIYLYYYSANKVDEKAKVMAEYLDEVKKDEGNLKALKRQTKMSNKLHKLSGFIESKIMKDKNLEDTKVNQELRKSDAAISKSMLTGSQSSQSNDEIDFEF